MKNLILSVPDEIYSAELEDFITDSLGFDIQGAGCGSSEYVGKGSVKALRFQLKKIFGLMVRKIIIEQEVVE